MTKPTFYITTPIYYPSDKLHIGHAYCTTIADTVARYHRAKGEDVFFLTGSDEHGLKIQRKATEMGVTPIQYVDEIIANFKLLWQRLNITNNDFIRTSEERHHKVVQSILQKIFEQGDIYKKNYENGNTGAGFATRTGNFHPDSQQRHNGFGKTAATGNGDAGRSDSR
mgnify:CR=1 FL=1